MANQARHVLVCPDGDSVPRTGSNRITNANLLRFVEAYRTHGHRKANLDPLGLTTVRYELALPDGHVNWGTALNTEYMCIDTVPRQSCPMSCMATQRRRMYAVAQYSRVRPPT